MTRKSSKKAGFTLGEIVLAIVGITILVAVIAIPASRAVRGGSLDTAKLNYAQRINQLSQLHLEAGNDQADIDSAAALIGILQVGFDMPVQGGVDMPQVLEGNPNPAAFDFDGVDGTQAARVTALTGENGTPAEAPAG